MVIRGYQTCMRAAGVVAPLAIWEAGSALVSPLNIVCLPRPLACRGHQRIIKFPIKWPPTADRRDGVGVRGRAELCYELQDLCFAQHNLEF